jgi:FtsZ-binding cell division protein ZapB
MAGEKPMKPLHEKPLIFSSDRWTQLTLQFTDITRLINEDTGNDKRVNALLSLQFEIEGLKAALREDEIYEKSLQRQPDAPKNYNDELHSDAIAFNTRLKSLQRRLDRLEIPRRPIKPISMENQYER